MTPPPTKTRRLRLVVLQPALAAGAVEANRERIRHQLAAFTDATGPGLVVLPEIYDGRTSAGDGLSDQRFLAGLAVDFKTHVIGGSCLVEDDGSSFNRCSVIKSNGQVIGHYDKRILFSGEARLRSVGDGPRVFELDGVRVAVLICADAWFPELGRELVNKANILAIPVKSTVPSTRHVEYGRRTWHCLALTRGMENGLVVAAADWATGVHTSNANRQGEQGAPRYFTCGAASIVDPSHRPQIDAMQRVLEAGEPGTIVADIDLSALEAYRTYRRSVGLLPA